MSMVLDCRTMSLQVIIDYQRVASEMIQQPARPLRRNSSHGQQCPLAMGHGRRQLSCYKKKRSSEVEWELGAIYLTVVGACRGYPELSFGRLASDMDPSR